MEGHGEVTRVTEQNYDGNSNGGGGGVSVGVRRSREDEHESRSGSDNLDGASGDEQDIADLPPRKKRYHRHTPQQIQELEAYALLFLSLFFLSISGFEFSVKIGLFLLWIIPTVCSKSVLTLMRSNDWSLAKSCALRPDKSSFGFKIAVLR